MGPVLVVAASNFASAIVIEAELSFLGVGVQPPQPSWGLMIKENYNFIITQNPMLALAPGFAIMVLVLAFNMLGSGLCRCSGHFKTDAAIEIVVDSKEYQSFVCKKKASTIYSNLLRLLAVEGGLEPPRGG